MRLTVLALVASLLALPVAAQNREQTLADIRQELSVLFVEVQQLARELSTTGGVIGGTQLPPSVLERVNVIESELQRLTARTEELQHRIDQIVKDGTNRIGDLEFRLCELETACDLGSLGDTPTLGGGALPNGPATAVPSDNGTPELAVGEKDDFGRAKAALESGKAETAAELFASFVEAYPGGPLTPSAHYLQGNALSQLGNTADAARAYLNAFSADPQGPEAPGALLRLGESLGALGQTSEACVMLGEVAVRFPGSTAVSEADAARGRLGCP